MTRRCIFCEIIAHQHQVADLIYEDEKLFVLWDLRQPKFGGHILIIPRTHLENLHHLPADLAGPFLWLAKIAADAVKAVLKCNGISIMISNGRCAGQTVLHLHLHILPRLKRFDFLAYYWRTFVLRRKFSPIQKAHLIQEIGAKIRALMTQSV